MYRRRAGRGVRGLGIVGYPSGYGEWLNPNWNDRFPGLGAMPTLTALQYQSLTPWQQQAYGNGDPNFMSATAPYDPNTAGTNYAAALEANAPTVSSTAQQLLASLQSTVQNPAYSTQQNIGAQPTTTYTLDSYMAKWAAEGLADPNVVTYDPMSEALAVAQGYCVTEQVSDCPNMSAIASKYGAMVAQAVKANAAATAAKPAFVPVTSPAATTNAVASSTPARRTNPAWQTTYPGNALSTVTYSGSVATGTPTTTLNPYNNVNVLGSSTTSNTQSGGGPLSTTGDTSWIWIVAIGAGVVLLMMNQGAKK